MSEDRDLSDLDLTSFSGYSGNELEDVAVLRYENGSVIENPVVFTDSFLLPLGMQVYIPMNTSESGLPVYQAFTIAGRLDSQRAGGFPLSSFNLLKRRGLQRSGSFRKTIPERILGKPNQLLGRSKRRNLHIKSRKPVQPIPRSRHPTTWMPQKSDNRTSHTRLHQHKR